MFEKLIQIIKDVVFLSEQARRNAEETKELRKRVEDLTLLCERLAFEIQRTRENEAHEREKLVLRLEKEEPKSEKLLSPKMLSRKQNGSRKISVAKRECDFHRARTLGRGNGEKARSDYRQICREIKRRENFFSA